MTAPAWKAIRFEQPTDHRDGTAWKLHVVPASLQRLLIADLTARGAKLLAQPDAFGGAVKRADGYRFDFGGAFFADEPMVALKLPGLRLRVQIGLHESVTGELKRLLPRYFDRRVRYVKFHGRYNCLVLTPDQRDAVVADLERVRDDVKAASDAYWATKKVSP